MNVNLKSIVGFVGIAACLVLFASIASAGTEKILHEFAMTDGENPYDGVVFDAAGNLYGTTFYGGGVLNCGVVFKLAPNAGGGWVESAIYIFKGGADGSHPYSPLIFDAAGNLYGATYGAYSGLGTGLGTVFKLTPHNDGAWGFQLLHTFTGGNDGAQPNASLALDAAGNLYGTTRSGGSYGDGIAFELTPTTEGQWKETLLHRFTGGQDGSAPFGLTLDSAGNVYGVTTSGGLAACSCGVVFELSPSDGNWNETILHQFTNGRDGGGPQSLVIDSSGTLYGAAETGGKANYCYGGCGVVFDLTPNEHGETILHTFNGVNGVGPGGLQYDEGTHSLYGSAYVAAEAGGLIFKLVADDEWAETILYKFSGSFVEGSEPVGPLALNRTGNVFGTTIFGGAADVGVVFEITP